MTWTSDDGHATLHHGDALATLHTLDDNHVDAVITDPPYSSGGMVRGDRTGSTVSKYVTTQNTRRDELANFTGDNRDQRAYGYWSALWLSEARRATRPGGILLVFSDWRQLPTTTDAVQAGGWIWRGIVPWSKPSARPQAGRFAASCEYVVWASNGPLPTDYRAPCLPGFFEGSPPRDRQHITQKPLDVMRGMVRIVPAGQLILDPFAGSGTTGCAALMEGRRFLGVEQDPHYLGVAAARLATSSGDTTGQDDLFEAAP